MSILTGITIDWSVYPHIINISKSTGNALVQIGGPGVDDNPAYVYSLNANDFHETLRDIEQSEQGMTAPTTHFYVSPKTVGGVTLAALMEVHGEHYNVQFEDGQYAVVLDGANTNIADLLLVNQVSVRTKNSAGMQNLDTLLASSYGDVVHVHTVDGQSGNSIPLGTLDTPVNNLADARAIASYLGISTIKLMNSIIIQDVDFSEGFTFTTTNINTVFVTINSSANVTNCIFDNCSMAGVLDGGSVIKNCNLYDVEYISGFISDCSLNGTVTMYPGAEVLSLIDCVSNIAGGGPTNKVAIDMNYTNCDLAVRHFSGSLELLNHNENGGAVSLDILSGRVILDSTVTHGDIYVRGGADVVDNSGPNCTVHDQTTYKMIENIANSNAKISLKDMILIGELSK